MGDLLLAAVEGTAEEVERLLSEGTDVGAALLTAARCNPRAEVLGVLLAAGAPLEVVDFLQRTPLHFAASHNTAEVVEYLIERGAHIGAFDGNGYSPLILAAADNPRPEVLDVLLAAGA
eukprot:Sspe_Gene.107515::Locus_85681_Transcript_1_2_Confidence_0.857_Length_401::g.107515::m.107515